MLIPDLREVLTFVRSDAAAGRLAEWGFSTVVDELVGREVVPEDVVVALHEAAETSATFPVGNAGLLHVYGYWFSTVLTPYGYKRDRWEDGRLAVALGRPADAFLLRADAGSTPLQRVTDAALPLLRTPPAGARVVDEAAGGLRARAVLVRVPGSGPTALVYGVERDGALRLVTAFPVDGDAERFAADLEVAPPRLRWNAIDPRIA